MAPQRRRLYLMRHGSVDYFEPDGRPIPPDPVPLNPKGRAQADAAGVVFAAAGVQFDRVVVSGLPRTVETAERVLAQIGSRRALDIDPDLREIRSGRLTDMAPTDLQTAFTGVFAAGSDLATIEHRRFLGGESIGELLDRTLPAFERWRARPDWDCMLMVLHGGVNRALLSWALTGQRTFFGPIEQTPACINVLDLAADHAVVRGINLAPTQWLQHGQRHTTMEELLAAFSGGLR